MNQLKVLLVDDETEFVTALAERLELRGFRAAIASGGEEALGRVEADEPQVVLLDVLMPGLGGLEVLKRIKSKHPLVQVILLTGRGSAEEGIEGMRLGAFDCMMKPIRIEELIQKMNESIAMTTRGESDQRG